MSQHKQRCHALEQQLVELVILAMERSENDHTPIEGTDGIPANHWNWLHLSSQLIYFVLFHFACFPTIVMAIHDRVSIFYVSQFVIELIHTSFTKLDTCFTDCQKGIEEGKGSFDVGSVAIHLWQYSAKPSE